ncbi:hypothetical protein NUU61_002191 [Penicillium alfredii]|uniref:Uncharacterized protein n=1 Tax=Penicillium alfredii TaxID=1506179 RepID=A0A9W9FR38_9EURO|nr:uncharacterized protein NUU61_002191 [Penicillium alfredii]KAJ5104844.1 hypothetical protein NUU61_002191 [Penicillium alfredii]
MIRTLTLASGSKWGTDFLSGMFDSLSSAGPPSPARPPPPGWGGRESERKEQRKREVLDPSDLRHLPPDLSLQHSLDDPISPIRTVFTAKVMKVPRPTSDDPLPYEPPIPAPLPTFDL